MFSHHLFEVLDCFERDIVLSVAKIHKRAGVSSVLWNHYFDWTVRINLRNGGTFAACRKCEAQSNEYDGYSKDCAGAHSNLDVHWNPTVVQNRARSHISVSF